MPCLRIFALEPFGPTSPSTDCSERTCFDPNDNPGLVAHPTMIQIHSEVPLT